MRKKMETREARRVLFIVKERTVYGTKTKAYGLYNSCDFVARRLRMNGIEAKVVQVIDNNCIDREVSQFKPTHCFIEAIWVVPSKFEVLAKLHPKVKWNIRLHSMLPFLASEGMAFEWLNQYMELRKKGIDITISCNNDSLYRHMHRLYGKEVTYTPNVYLPDEECIATEKFDIAKSEDSLHIGCFGALRVLKNHPQQAAWAIEFADELKRKLHFHINVSEHEQREAGPILRNLRGIFANTKHVLVEHPWYNHCDFLELVRKMDIGMQISFTETFNVTAADFVSCGVPIVVSRDIKFVHPCCRVDPSDEKGVMSSLRNAIDNYIPPFSGGLIFGSCLKCRNKTYLDNHNLKATAQWISVLEA
jgi:hypothetical protein